MNESDLEKLLLEGIARYSSEEYEAALSIFKTCAEYGEAGAMNYLGCMYSRGHYVSVDIDKSTEWHLRAINHGDDASFSNIAINYRCIGDLVKSKEWFEKALNIGDLNAALNLAKMYMVSDKEKEIVIELLERVFEHPEQVCTAYWEEAESLLDELG